MVSQGAGELVGHVDQDFADLPVGGVDVPGGLLILQRGHQQGIDRDSHRHPDPDFDDPIHHQQIFAHKRAGQNEDRGRGHGRAFFTQAGEKPAEHPHQQCQAERP